jgi:hypothetical protein
VDCDDILELVRSGEKDVERRPEFIEHLQACARCREEAMALLAAARAIRAAPEGALAGHPSSDQIVTLALDPDAAALDINRPLAVHVAGCATCKAELDEVRRAEQSRLSQAHPRPGLGALSSFLRVVSNLTHAHVPAAIALVTGLGLVLLVYPAYLGLRHLPLVKGQLGDLDRRARQLETEVRELSASLAQANRAVSRPTHWSGPLRLLSLTSPLRGQTPEPTFGLEATEPFILISMRPILDESATDSDLYRIILAGQANGVAWSAELTAGEIRRQMRSSGALFFSVPSSLLVPGRHELRVLSVKNPRVPILQIPFETR